MDVSNRLKYLLKESGLTQNEIAEKTGFSQSYISAVSNGKKMPLDNIVKFCDLLGIDLVDFFQPFQKRNNLPTSVAALLADCRDLTSEDAETVHALTKYLLSKSKEKLRSLTLVNNIVDIDSEEAEEEEEEDEEPKYYLPLLGGAAAGSPIYRPADDGDAVVVPECYADPDRYAVFQARGDSMEPRIPDGAFIVTEVNVLPADGEVAVVMLSSFSDAEYVVKRVYRKRNSAILRSYNPKYTDMVVAADEIRSAYRMVEIIR